MPLASIVLLLLLGSGPERPPGPELTGDPGQQDASRRSGEASRQNPADARDLQGAPLLRVTTADGEVLLSLSLAGEHEWIVRWNHSVTGILVSDYYRLEGGQMLLTASHTPAFDAGLGHIPGRGRLEDDGAGGYWILEIDEAVPGNAYHLRVAGARSNHRIVHAGRTYSLTELAAGRRVRLEVVP